MSRPYKISTPPPHGTIRVTATDEVKTRIEIPPILPPEAQASILSQVLKERGFTPDEEGGKMTREGGGVKVQVDPSTGEVDISSEESADVPVPPPSGGGCPCSSRLPRAASQASQDAAARGLQGRVTGRLERALGPLGCELERVGNQVAAKALVQKAKTLGEVKKITHDNESGSVTIVVEV